MAEKKHDMTEKKKHDRKKKKEKKNPPQNISVNYGIP